MGGVTGPRAVAVPGASVMVGIQLIAVPPPQIERAA